MGVIARASSALAGTLTPIQLRLGASGAKAPYPSPIKGEGGCVTSDLIGRIHQHREGTLPGFTREHGVKMLVWFEPHATMEQAILREKRIKKWLRVWKLELIEKDNLAWRDLA